MSPRLLQWLGSSRKAQKKTGPWKPPSSRLDFEILELRNGPTETIGGALSLAFMANALVPPPRLGPEDLQPTTALSRPHQGSDFPAPVETPILHPHQGPNVVNTPLPEHQDIAVVEGEKDWTASPLIQDASPGDSLDVVILSEMHVILAA
jgi:hypothetical protein